MGMRRNLERPCDWYIPLLLRVQFDLVMLNWLVVVVHPFRIKPNRVQPSRLGCVLEGCVALRSTNIYVIRVRPWFQPDLV